MEVHIFPQDICSKVNIIAQAEFEPSYHDVAVQYFSPPATGLPLIKN